MSKIINFIKKRWIWILAVLLLFAVIVSSIEIYKEEVLNIDPDIKYKQKSTLYFAAERFDTLNPIVSQSEDVYYISKLLYDSLFDFDDNMNATPELVEKYTVDTEKASVYIKLKKEASRPTMKNAQESCMSMSRITGNLRFSSTIITIVRLIF